MTYQRVIGRNNLQGDYEPDGAPSFGGMIRGDLRRLEADQRDTMHLEWYAETCGVTEEQAKAVLDAFFGYALPQPDKQS